MDHRLLVVLALPLVCGNAGADEPVGEWGRLYPAISWTTDYRFNGVSNSNRSPSVQAFIHWWRPDDYYAGLWVSQVDFQDPNSTSFELSTYVGRRFDVDAMEYRLEVMYTAFDDNVPGPTYDFLQFKAAATRRLDIGSLAGSIRWSPQGPYAAGRTTYADLKATAELNDWLSASSLIGVGIIQRRPDRWFWNAGVTARWRKFSVDVRYVDTSLGLVECGHVDWCEPATVVTVTLAGH